MAGRNAINKPKIKLLANSHSKTLGRRRAAARANAVQTRSSSSRYADRATTAPRPTDSKAVALFTGETPRPRTKMTTSSLSKKRAKKIARNQRYLTKQQEEDILMQVDSEVNQNKFEAAKKALWGLVEEFDANGPRVVPDPEAEGTTLGVQAF
ncbi:uncharacterized protein LODBEIA_P57910 [Lodderomyces beijingensis]|uniref:Ribosome biogenesis protein ALB1 n=1 Tax=Lodderomyces beijingensis TaxID=1775926 RepID=A0ABP0ZWL1_9ASCO